MSNFRRENVGYRKLELEPMQPQGLLAVARAGGELEAKVANFMFRVADEFGKRADREAELAGLRDGKRAALAGRPGHMQVSSGNNLPEMAGGTEVPSRPTPIQQQVNLSGNRQKFIDTLMPAAIEASKRTGVDPRIIVAQAAQETGWGRSAPGNNYFGIKSHGQSGGQTFTTHEVINGQRVKIRDSFRSFASPQDSVAGYADFITTNPRYTNFRNAQGLDAQLSALQASGYATDPNYSNAVGAIARAINFAPGESGQAMPATHVQAVATAGAPNATQVATPAIVTRLPGQEQTFRPTNRDSVYGRAYDAAGTRTFLQMLDSEIRSTTMQAFRLHENDPSQLSVTLETLKHAQLRDDVPDEIRAEYEVAFDAQAQRYLFQAQANADRMQKEANIQAFEGRSQQLGTDIERMLAGFDPELPGVDASIAEAQLAIDDHYDTAVANGVMTWQQAETAKSKSRSDTAVSFYLRQAEALTPDEISSMRETMEADFASGNLTGIDGAGWRRLKAGLEQAQAGRAKEIAGQETAIDNEGTRLADRALAGFEIGQNDLNRFMLDIGKTGNDDLASATLAKIEAAEIMRDMPLPEAIQHVAKMRANLPKDASDAEIASVVYAEQRVQQLAELAEKDPAAYEIQRGRLKLEPIILQAGENGQIDTVSLDQSLAMRRDQMRAVSERFGRDVSFFRPGEVSALSRSIAENPDMFPDFAASIVAVHGAQSGKVLAEISEEMPTLAHAAGVFAATGDRSLSVDLAQAMSAKAKGEFKQKMPVQEKFAAAAGEGFSKALAFKSDVRASTLGVAQLLYEADANRFGFDPSEINKPDTPAAQAWSRALERSLGGQTVNGVRTGGLGEVNGHAIVVPPGMAKDAPQNLLSRLNDTLLEQLPPIYSPNGVPVTASQIRRAQLVSEQDGKFSVWLDDPFGWNPQYVAAEPGPDGSPRKWLLDMREIEKLIGESVDRQAMWGWRIPGQMQ